MRKAIKFLLSTVLVLVSLVACSTEELASVPNVMGIAYTDAQAVIEDAGFKVTAIEADASSILPNTAWDRSVKKGEVFKVNDETYPAYGNEVMNPTNEEKSVTIYYAKEDYTYTEPDKESVETEPAEEASEADTSVPAEASSATESPANVEWREWLAEYEAWVDSYIELSEKYTENPTDATIMTEYLDALGKLAEWSIEADEVEIELENDPQALSEYLETLSRITQKLSQIGY